MGNILERLDDSGVDIYKTTLHEGDGGYVVRVTSPFLLNPDDRKIYGNSSATV